MAHVCCHLGGGRRGSIYKVHGDVETSSAQPKDTPSEKLLKLCRDLARQKDTTFWMHRRQLTSARLRKDAGLDGKAAHSP